MYFTVDSNEPFPVVHPIQVIVPKQKGEILGIVIVESGWGSMLPTVVIANMAQASPSARCGQLNIGDQIIAINGISLVGLPLSTCQSYVKVGPFSVPFGCSLGFILFSTSCISSCLEH